MNPYIIKKKSKIHNYGIYARRDIPKGTRIIEYVGEKVTKKEAGRRCDLQLEKASTTKDEGYVYVFELNARYDIDGNVPYNTAKYINHSCDPNCETDIIRGHIWIISIRTIKKGEEITYNYGYGPDDYQDHPCRCGAKDCTGYILAEEHRPKLKKKLKKAREKV